MMSQIMSLKPNMSLAEATKRFRGGAVQGWFHSWRRGAFIGVRDVYIPYRLFRVTISNRGQQQTSWMALDAISGRLDPYRFESLPDESDLLVVKSEAAFPSPMSVDELRTWLVDLVRRQVYLNGFFRLRDLRIETEYTGRDLYIPYWVGIYRKDQRLSIDVIDAVRKQFEGAKVRDVILHWLGRGTQLTA